MHLPPTLPAAALSTTPASSPSKPLLNSTHHLSQSQQLSSLRAISPDDAINAAWNDESAPSISEMASDEVVFEAGNGGNKVNGDDEEDYFTFSMRDTEDSEEHMMSTESFVGTVLRQNVDEMTGEENADQKSEESSKFEGATPKRKPNTGVEETQFTTPGSIFSGLAHSENLDCDAPYTDGRARVYLRRRGSQVFALEHRASHSCPQLPSKQHSKRQKRGSQRAPRLSIGRLGKENLGFKAYNSKIKIPLPDNFVKEQLAYFNEVDAFKLEEEDAEE